MDSTTSEHPELDKLKIDFFRDIDEIFGELEKYGRLPETFVEVADQIAERKIALDDLKSARNSTQHNNSTQHSASQSNGTNWIELNCY